jgi:SAM-dependent methyltransferase
VVMSLSDTHGLRPARVTGDALKVLWHDLECGGYGADLPLWRELAEHSQIEREEAPILEVGAGTGRVALALARAGHRVTALDLDGALLCALSRRAAGTTLETIHADARTFALERRDYALCIAPMQTVQLLGGSPGRVAFLRHARAHLRPGGIVACAIVIALESFDTAGGDLGPSAESAHVDEHLYTTRATGVRVYAHTIEIERERRILAPRRPAAPLASERAIVELDRVSQAELEREGVEAGLTPTTARTVSPTDDHVGSLVVMLRA